MVKMKVGLVTLSSELKAGSQWPERQNLNADPELRISGSKLLTPNSIKAPGL